MRGADQSPDTAQKLKQRATVAKKAATALTGIKIRQISVGTMAGFAVEHRDYNVSP
jgi:hypothetical protein